MDDPTSLSPPAVMQEPDATASAGWGKRASQKEAHDASVDGAVVGQGGPRRYQVVELLGRGGMGEVFLALDERVGREVALKVSLDMGERRERFRTRFFREARVQGNLEHPGIVPVYDLDRDTTGRDFFAMKRVAGVTLENVVRDLAKGDLEAETKYPMRRLLAAFLQVCLAVDYAHSNGVVHRDLKLSNLMLGDFGEVYVLDWGVAKVEGAEEFTRDPVTGAHSDVAETNQDMLGTLGYMAPEQIRDSSSVDARADVYALGVILFALLARQRLHTQKGRVDLTNATYAGADARASVRAQHLNIPPELDVICVKATELDPSRRYPSARALHDEVQRFLEGDRDLRLRIEVAERHLNEAKRVLASPENEAGGVTERRRRALQQTGRALAVHPESHEAAAFMSSLLLTPPDQVPPEVELETRTLSQRELARTGTAGIATLVALGVGGPILANWVGVRSWAILGSFLGLAGLTAGTALASLRAPHRIEIPVLGSVFMGLAIAMTSRIAGPLWISSAIATAYIAFISGAHGLGRWRLVCFAMALAGIVVPWGLEASGVVPSQYVFSDGMLCIVEDAVEIGPTRTMPALLITILAPLLVGTGVLWHYSSQDMQSRRKLQLMAWHLRQLAPAPDPQPFVEWNADGGPPSHSAGGPPPTRAHGTIDEDATLSGR